MWIGSRPGAARYPGTLELILFGSLRMLAGFVTAALLLGSLAACAPGAPSAGTRGGEERGAPVSDAPRRIVSLAPSLTEILFEIGAGPQVVGVDTYSDFPAEARRLPRLGALLDPDVEAMLRLRPDLAVLLPSQSEVAGALRTAGVPTVTLPHETLSDLEHAILVLGRRTGHAAAAAELSDSLRTVWQRAPVSAGAAPARRVLFVIGREEGQLASFTVAGPGTYLDELIRLAGGVNAVADAPVRYPQVSAETVLRLRPDLILEWAPVPLRARTSDVGIDDARRTFEWRALHVGFHAGGPAIEILHEDLWLRPGPRVVQALEQLRRLIGGS